MSRRYAASERVREYSEYYYCTIDYIPGRKIVHTFEPLPLKRRIYPKTGDRVKDIANYLRDRGEATSAEIVEDLGMSKSAVRNVFDGNPGIFRSRASTVQGKKWPVNLWSLRESKKIGSGTKA